MVTCLSEFHYFPCTVNWQPSCPHWRQDFVLETHWCVLHVTEVTLGYCNTPKIMIYPNARVKVKNWVNLVKEVMHVLTDKSGWGDVSCESVIQNCRLSRSKIKKTKSDSKSSVDHGSLHTFQGLLKFSWSSLSRINKESSWRCTTEGSKTNNYRPTFVSSSGSKGYTSSCTLLRWHPKSNSKQPTPQTSTASFKDLKREHEKKLARHRRDKWQWTQSELFR